MRPGLKSRRGWLVLPVTAMVLAASAGCESNTDEGVLADAPASSAETASTPSSATVISSTNTVAPDESVAVADSRCVAPSGGAQQEIAVWYAIGNDSEKKLIELTDRFNELATGVTVRLEKSGNYSETLRALGEAAPDDRPDALLTDVKGLRDIFDSGLVVTPNDCAAAGASSMDDLLPVVASSYSINGVLQAFPYNVSIPVLMFDASLLRAAGLDPDEPPRTLEELSSTAQQIVESGVAPHGFVAWDGYGPWFVTQYNSRRGQLSGIPDNGREGEPVAKVDFASPEVVESFDWLRTEVETGRALWIGGNPSGTDDLLRLVDRADGAAMTITTSGAIGDIARLLGSGALDDPATGLPPELGVGPMPGPGSGALVGGGAFVLLDSGDAGRVGAASSFVSWLSDAPQHAEFAGYTGFSPIRSAELDQPTLRAAWEETPQLRVAFDELVDLSGDVVRSGPAWGAGFDIDRLLYETLTAAIENGGTLVRLRDATAQANSLLGVYNAGIGG